MLRIRDILQFPSFYSKRQQSVRQTQVSITNVNKEEEFIDIEGVSKNYKTFIRIYGTNRNLNPNTNVSIHCDCKSFQFEFANAVFKDESLLYPEKFDKELISKPVEKNKYMIASGCKHIIALANLFNQQRNRLL